MKPFVRSVKFQGHASLNGLVKRVATDVKITHADTATDKQIDTVKALRTPGQPGTLFMPHFMQYPKNTPHKY